MRMWRSLGGGRGEVWEEDEPIAGRQPARGIAAATSALWGGHSVAGRAVGPMASGAGAASSP